MKNRTAFSVITGKLFEVGEDEIAKLDNNQLLLRELPSIKCKKCFGRFHVGKNLKNNYYTICPKCAIICLDLDDMEKRFLKKSASEGVEDNK